MEITETNDFKWCAKGVSIKFFLKDGETGKYVWSFFPCKEYPSKPEIENRKLQIINFQNHKIALRNDLENYENEIQYIKEASKNLLDKMNKDEAPINSQFREKLNLFVSDIKDLDK